MDKNDEEDIKRNLWQMDEYDEHEDHIFYRDKTPQEKSQTLKDLSDRVDRLIEKMDTVGQLYLNFNLKDINDMILLETTLVECMEKDEEKEIGNKFLKLLNMIKEHMEKYDGQ